MRRHVHRPDGNQAGLVDLAERLGASVAITSQVGDGFPDLVIGFQGRNYLVEVKVPGGKLRPKQTDFIRTWRGHPVAVIDNGDDLVRLLLSREIPG